MEVSAGDFLVLITQFVMNCIIPVSYTHTLHHTMGMMGGGRTMNIRKVESRTNTGFFSLLVTLYPAFASYEKVSVEQPVR